MAAGDVTLTNLGSYDISGAGLFAAAAAQNITYAQHVSGSRLHFIPTGNGLQITLYKELRA